MLTVLRNVLAKFDQAVSPPGVPTSQPETAQPTAFPAGMLFRDLHFCSVSPLDMHVSSKQREKIDNMWIFGHWSPLTIFRIDMERKF